MKMLEASQVEWEEERKKLNQQVENLNTKIKGLENTIEQKDLLIKQIVSISLSVPTNIYNNFHYRKTVWLRRGRLFPRPA